MVKKVSCIVLSMIVLFTYAGLCAETSGTELFLTSLSVIMNTSEGSEEVPVPGFASENPERDYYFGIEEMPASSELLPGINAVSDTGEVNIEYEFEPGGYVANIIISETEKFEEYRLHFREAENITIPVTAFFSVRGAYIRQEAEKFNVVNDEYGYAEFDLSILPADVLLTEVEYSARNAYNPEPITAGYSNYSSLDALRAGITASGGHNMDFSLGFDIIATNPIDSSNSHFTCSFIPEPEKISSKKLVLVLKKESGSVSYFYESQLTVKYLQKEYNISDEITMGKISYYGEDGNAPVVAEGNTVTVEVPLTASADNQGDKSYAVFSVCYCNGKLVDSDFIYNTIAPGAPAFETLYLTIGENPVDFSIVTVIWDSAEGMHPLAYSQEYFGE